MKHLRTFENFLNENLDDKRSETWSIEYMIIMFYCYKFGLSKKIGMDEPALSSLMQVTLGSFMAHLRQFVFLEGDLTDIGLAKPGFNLEYVFEKYRSYTEPDLRKKVLEILDEIENGMINIDFVNRNKSTNENPKLSKEEKLKKQTNKKIKKADFEEFIKSYEFEKGEIITLHNKNSTQEPYDCVITKGGINPYFSKLSNKSFEMGPMNKKLYDIIYPHILGDEYKNVKIDLTK
jgi:hypothetical protein